VLTPEDIASRSFLVSLRGYDRDEVHSFLSEVADEVGSLQARIDELEELLTSPDGTATEVAPEAPVEPEAVPEPEVVEPEPAPQPAAPTPSDLFASISAETQRILEAAQTAGEELRRKATEEAQRERTEAHEAAEQERAEAHAAAEQERAEAHDAAQRELTEAHEAAERERAEAHAEADREVKAARAEANRIIADGERRREAIEEVVRELGLARDAIAGDLREVGRTVERALRELVVDDEPVETMRSALAASVRDDAEVEAPPEAGPAAVVPTAVASEDARFDREAGAADGDGAAEVDDADRAAADEPAADEPDAAGTAEAGPSEDTSTPADEPDAETHEPAAEPVDAGESDAATAAPADPDDDAEAAQPQMGADDAAVAVPDAFDAARGTDRVEPEDAADASAAAGAPATSDAVGDGERTATSAAVDLADEAPAQEDRSGDDASSTDELPIGAPEQGAALDLDDDLLEQAQELRAQALAPLHPKLVRKLKRGMQDLQNGMLDRLRRADGKGEVAAFLPDAAALQTLTDLTEEFLVSAYWAGAASGELLAGEEVDAAGPEGQLSRELTATLSEQLLADLEATLGAGLGMGEDAVGLGERVGTVFSEVKEAPVEEQAALALLRVYEEGLAAAWQVGRVTHRHWALASEPACTDPRCADNHRAGPVALDEPFPSGHRVPPVRVGCNCTTVPAVT
jgi:DivIVA domain-containing protein